MEILTQLGSEYPQFKDEYASFRELHSLRLWHQLTIKLLNFVSPCSNYIDDNMIRLANDFISKIENYLDPLEFAMINCLISRQMYPDYERALKFIKTIGEVTDPKSIPREKPDETVMSSQKKKRDVIGEYAFIRYVLEVSLLYIKIGQMEIAQDYLDESKIVLDSFSIQNSRLFSIYYRVALEFNKARNDVDQIYASALKWLVYTPLSSLQLSEQASIVKDLLTSALLSQEVFLFGSVLTPEVQKVSESADFGWLFELVTVLNKGNIHNFSACSNKYKDKLLSECNYAVSKPILEEKSSLLSLVEYVFHLPTNNHTLKFQEISSICCIDIRTVEKFLIRGAGLGLFKCILNQVDEKVTFTWLQPRILDASQVDATVKMLNNWTLQIQDTCSFIKTKLVETSSVK